MIKTWILLDIKTISSTCRFISYWFTTEQREHRMKHLCNEAPQQKCPALNLEDVLLLQLSIGSWSFMQPGLLLKWTSLFFWGNFLPKELNFIPSSHRITLKISFSDPCPNFWYCRVSSHYLFAEHIISYVLKHKAQFYFSFLLNVAFCFLLRICKFVFIYFCLNVYLTLFCCDSILHSCFTVKKWLVS